jgi:hypothetical protein
MRISYIRRKLTQKMGRLFIPEENIVDGPWFMSHAKLESLNTLFHEIDANLKEALKITLKNGAKQQMEEDGQPIDLTKRIAKLERKNSQKIKYAEVYFEDGSSYRADDIEGIIQYIDSNPFQSPVDLSISTIQGNRENEFALLINSNPEEDDPDFEYHIRCMDEEIQQKIKSLIDKWVRENKPNKLIELWHRFNSWFLGLSLAIVALSALFIDATPSYDTIYKKELKKEAHKIIENQYKPTLDSSSILLLLPDDGDWDWKIREKTKLLSILGKL